MQLSFLDTSRTGLVPLEIKGLEDLHIGLRTFHSLVLSSKIQGTILQVTRLEEC